MTHNLDQVSVSFPVCYWQEYSDLVFYYKSTQGPVNLNSSNTRLTTSGIITYDVPKCKLPHTKTPIRSELLAPGHLSKRYIKQINMSISLSAFILLLFYRFKEYF